MAGGLFSIDRAYFYEVGSYDSGSLCRFATSRCTRCVLHSSSFSLSGCELLERGTGSAFADASNDRREKLLIDSSNREENPSEYEYE